MNISSSRIVASGALTLAMAPVFGLTAGPAFAEVDLEAVAESISESGYYVDSKATYYESDGAQELLRQAQGRSVPVFVAVVPAGNNPNQLLQRLPGLVNRKGTYAVLAGDQLRVSSTSLPESRVKATYAKAIKASKGKPDLALLRFVQMLPESKYAPPKPGMPGNNGKPAPETPPAEVQRQEEQTLAEPKPPAPPEADPEAASKDGGSSMPLLLGGGGLVAVAAAAGGFLLWRRRSLTPATPGAPAPGAPGPNAPAPGAPAGQPPASGAPAPEGQARPPAQASGPGDGAPGDSGAPGDGASEPPKES